MSSGPFQDVEEHVHLILALNPAFYLKIPITEISSFCLRPRKYLLFLAWCILGIEGDLATALNTSPLDLDGTLDDGGLYYYVVNGAISTDLSHAVDLEVIRQRSTVSSKMTNTHDAFHDKLRERDRCCVFTGSQRGHGIHIIPFKRGSEWFRGIIDNRPNDDENVDDLVDIDDIRNGLYVLSSIDSWFDTRDMVILKTPNRYLDQTDIPRANRPLELLEGLAFPRNVRYTVQWLGEPDEFMERISPNNIDAAFIRSTKKRKPSGLLLHYNYGAAAVKRWGHGLEVLENQPNLARPATMGAPRTVHDTIVADSTNVTPGTQPGESPDLKQTRWDEDDVMLFFWGDSRAATERHRKKQEESTRDMEQWRQGLPS